MHLVLLFNHLIKSLEKGGNSQFVKVESSWACQIDGIVRASSWPSSKVTYCE
jgi:hypothetical protein